jgi:hypothetical protein
MQTFEIELWEKEFRKIPTTTVEAETRMQARALGLGDFRRLQVGFSAVTAVNAREENEDENQSETERVAGVVEWANSRGKSFVLANGLEWLLTFK